MNVYRNDGISLSLSLSLSLVVRRGQVDEKTRKLAATGTIVNVDTLCMRIWEGGGGYYLTQIMRARSPRSKTRRARGKRAHFRRNYVKGTVKALGEGEADG